MASLTGAPADKLGNEFERLWISRLLLQVISDRASVVRIEPKAPVELKTECFVTKPNGTVECHQCKRENGFRGKWTVPNLESEGIISAAKLFLSESPNHRYVFVSGDRAPGLSTLCERAVKFDRAEEFFA